MAPVEPTQVTRIKVREPEEVKPPIFIEINSLLLELTVQQAYDLFQGLDNALCNYHH